MVSLIVLGWVQRATFRKDLAGEHLVMGSGLINGAIALVKLDRRRGGVLVHRVVLARNGALAGLTLAGDHGRIGRHDERRQRFLRLFDFGGQTLGGAPLGADALLVLLPEPADEDYGPDGDDRRARHDRGDNGCFGAVAF